MTKSENMKLQIKGHGLSQIKVFFFFIIPTFSATSMSNSMDILAREVVAYHFCQMDNEPTCIIPYFVHSVAAQMSQTPNLVAYRRLIANDGKLQTVLSMASCLADPHKAFVKGIIFHILFYHDVFMI